jgi:hypothetical protein
MIDSKDRDADLEYGNKAWIAGFIAGALLLWLMFHLATGFS